MALPTVTVHGEIVTPVTNIPAVGTVQFRIIQELRDIVDNITYSPQTFTATLDINGEFTIVLPATDSPDVLPLNWAYWVNVSTNAWNPEPYYVQIPFAPGVTEFVDLLPIDYDPCTGLSGGAVVIPPDAGDLFVRKTGDTMSGNLIINANLQVAGDTNIDGDLTLTIAGSSINVGQALIAAQSTAPLFGGELTPNADPTKIDISAMTGLVVDFNNSIPISPTNPTITFVTYPGATGITPAFAPITHYFVDSTGTLIQQAAAPTPAQRRQMIYLGLSLTQGGILVVDQTLPVIPSQLNNQLVDFMSAAAPFSTSGNVLSANGVNLSINKTVGNIFARAFSQVPNYLDPHNSILAAQTPIQFRHITRVVGSAGPLTNILNVGFYDNGGVLTPVGGGANSSTNFRVFGFANNNVVDQILIQYGQNVHASLAAAVNAIPSGTYIQQPATTNGALLGWISVIRTATNLSDPAQAVFTKASKFANP